MSALPGMDSNRNCPPGEVSIMFPHVNWPLGDETPALGHPGGRERPELDSAAPGPSLNISPASPSRQVSMPGNSLMQWKDPRPLCLEFRLDSALLPKLCDLVEES